MERGYIKLWRKMLDSKSASRGANYIAMMVYLLLRANWSSSSYKGRDLQPGELAVTLPGLSDALGLSIQTVRTTLKNLEKDGFILCKKSTGNFTSVSICNFSIYQATTNDNQQTTNRQLTDDQQTTNRRLTAFEEGKESKEYINNTPIAPACACEGDAEKILGPELAEDFKRFLYVWKDTHGHGREMNFVQQEAQLRTLVTIPEDKRKDAIERAIRGGWKAIHRPEELEKSPAPGNSTGNSRKRYNPADPSTW